MVEEQLEGPRGARPMLDVGCGSASSDLELTLMVFEHEG